MNPKLILTRLLPAGLAFNQTAVICTYFIIKLGIGYEADSLSIWGESNGLAAATWLLGVATFVGLYFAIFWCTRFVANFKLGSLFPNLCLAVALLMTCAFALDATNDILVVLRVFPGLTNL